jgi:flagellar hook assembly protein FlgD
VKGIELNIYDIAGRLVGTIVPEFQSSRVQRAEWDSRDNKGMKVKSGIFFIKLSSKAYKFKETRKIIKLR